MFGVSCKNRLKQLVPSKDIKRSGGTLALLYLNRLLIARLKIINICIASCEVFNDDQSHQKVNLKHLRDAVKELHLQLFAVVSSMSIKTSDKEAEISQSPPPLIREDGASTVRNDASQI